jgi:hypothetical protein
MDARGHDPEVRRQVDALIGSLDDTLPDERILQELETLKPGGQTFQQIVPITPWPASQDRARMRID